MQQQLKDEEADASSDEDVEDAAPTSPGARSRHRSYGAGSDDASDASGLLDSKLRSQKRSKRKDGSKARASSAGGGAASLDSLKHRLKLKHLKVSRGQFLRFSSRIGRRLLKNQIFLDKLADCLDGASASDASEKDEEPWGLDDGEADLDGYDQQEYSEGMLESTESDEGHEGANNRSKLSYPSGQQSRLQEADGSDSQEDSYGVSGEEDESSIQQSDPEAGADNEAPKIVTKKRKEAASSQERNNSSQAGATSVSPRSPLQSPGGGSKSPK